MPPRNDRDPAPKAAPQGVTLQWLQQWRQCNLARCDLETLFALSFLGRYYLAEYSMAGHMAPAWVEDRCTAITSALQAALGQRGDG